MTTTTRTEVLDQARAIVTGDRQVDYGDAAASFARIAQLWTATLGHDVTATQVALCLLQLKIARAVNNPAHVDSWVDMAGYAALGAEVSGASAHVPVLNIPLTDDETVSLAALRRRLSSAVPATTSPEGPRHD